MIFLIRYFNNILIKIISMIFLIKFFNEISYTKFSYDLEFKDLMMFYIQNSFGITKSILNPIMIKIIQYNSNLAIEIQFISNYFNSIKYK